METIYIMILFFGPGLLIMAVEDSIYNGRKANKNIYDYLFHVVMHGVVVFAIAVTWLNRYSEFKINNVKRIAKINNTVVDINVIQKWSDMKIDSISGLMAQMDKVNFALAYIILVLAVCIVWWFVYDTVLKKQWIKIKNKLLKGRTGTKHDEYPSVYEGIFHNTAITYEHLMPVSIYQDGQYVTSGVLKKFNSPNSQIMEFGIEFSEEIEEILEDDKKKEKSEKILGYIRFEYFMPEYNTLIKFYNCRELEKHWHDQYGDNN